MLLQFVIQTHTISILICNFVARSNMHSRNDHIAVLKVLMKINLLFTIVTSIFIYVWLTSLPYLSWPMISLCECASTTNMNTCFGLFSALSSICFFVTTLFTFILKTFIRLSNLNDATLERFALISVVRLISSISLLLSLFFLFGEHVCLFLSHWYHTLHPIRWHLRVSYRLSMIVEVK